MPIRLIFRCHYCDAVPDDEVQATLRRYLQHLRHGEFLDAAPRGWMLWSGRGMYGPPKYACPQHRGELVAGIREDYGTLGWHPWKMGPYPDRERHEGLASPRFVGKLAGRSNFG